MLIERQASKQKQRILIALIIAVNALVGYMVYNNFVPKKRAVKSGEIVRIETSAGVEENISAIETLAAEFDRTLLDSQEFRTLEKYGAWPVDGAYTGRANPFLPAFGP